MQNDQHQSMEWNERILILRDMLMLSTNRNIKQMMISYSLNTLDMFIPKRDVMKIN